VIDHIEKILGLGLSPTELTFSQMLLRALVVFFAMLAMMRLAGRRFLAQRNPFDTLLAFLMASMLSRDINGTTAFWKTLGTGFVLAILYRALAALACQSHKFGCWIKGEPQVIVQNGEMQKTAMTRHNVSEHDLHEDLRLNGAINDLKQVEIACIERNGQISVQRKPQIFSISVEKGVQTVQIQIT
jgi:uncharacterized membrane protein YcaP (DUF421 family)